MIEQLPAPTADSPIPTEVAGASDADKIAWIKAHFSSHLLSPLNRDAGDGPDNWGLTLTHPTIGQVQVENSSAFFTSAVFNALQVR